MKSVKLQGNKTQYCSGDLRERIIIQIRSISPPTLDNVDFSETFVQRLIVWATVSSKAGEMIFDGTSVSVAKTTFTIRFIPNITFENWIEFKGDRYEILSVTNFEEKDLFYSLECNKRGPKELPVNSSGD